MNVDVDVDVDICECLCEGVRGGNASWDDGCETVFIDS